MSKRRRKGGGKSSKVNPTEQIAQLKQQLQQSQQFVQQLEARLQQYERTYGKLTDKYEDFVDEGERNAIRLVTTVLVDSSEPPTYGPVPPPVPMTSVVVLYGNNSNGNNVLGSTADGNRMMTHIAATIRRLFICQPKPPSLEARMISLADFQRKATQIDMSPLAHLLVGLLTGRAPPTTRDFVANYTTLGQRKPIIAAAFIEDIINGCLRELGNNKGKKTDLQRWMEQIFQSFDLPNKFHDLFALLNVVPGRVQGKTAKQAGVTRDQFLIREDLPEEIVTKLITDNVHFRYYGKVLDFSMEMVTYHTAKDLWDLGLLTKDILDGHRPREFKDFDCCFPNPSDHGVQEEDYNYLNDVCVAYIESALSSLAQSIRAVGSLNTLVTTVLYCHETKDRYTRVSTLLAGEGVTIEGAPGSLVNAATDDYFVVLEPEREMPPCPPDWDPFLYWNRVSQFDVVFNSLSSREGCLRVLHVREYEAGYGDTAALQQRFTTGSNNDDADGDVAMAEIHEGGAVGEGGADGADGTDGAHGADGIDGIDGIDVIEEEEIEEEDENANIDAPIPDGPAPPPVSSTSQLGAPWELDDPEDQSHIEEQYRRCHAQELVEMHKLGALFGLVDGSPAYVWSNFFRKDGEDKTSHADDGRWKYYSGMFHAMKAMFDASGRSFDFFIAALIKPFINTAGECSHFINGTDPRTRQNLEPQIVTGLRMGIALAYLVSLQENAGIDESGLMEQLESVHWKDVDNYMMEMAKQKPALLVIVMYLRTTPIASLQRSNPKRGDQEGFAGIRRTNRLATVWCAVTNKYKYTELFLDANVDYTTDSKVRRAMCQRVGLKAKSSNNLDSTPDKQQEHGVKKTRGNSDGSGGGKIFTMNTEKNMRNNQHNQNERYTIQHNLCKGLGLDPNLINLTEAEHQQHRNERAEEILEQQEEAENDPKLTKEIEPMTIRAMQVALNLFHPSESKDIKGNRVPDDIFVSPADINEELNPEWILAFEIGQQRIEEWVRTYYYKDRPVEFDVDVMDHSQQGDRKMEKRRKEEYEYVCNFFNGRFTTASKKKRGCFKTILGLTKMMEKRNKMRRDRLTTKSWRDIDAEYVGDEAMFTKDQIIEEIIQMRTVSNTPAGTGNKKWFKKFLVHDDKELNTDIKMRKVKNKCQKSDLAKMLANLRIKGVPNSEDLPSLNSSGLTATITEENEIKLGDDVIDVFNTPFINNTLVASEGDITFDMRGVDNNGDGGVAVEVPSFQAIAAEFGEFLGHPSGECECEICEDLQHMEQ